MAYAIALGSVIKADVNFADNLVEKKNKSFKNLYKYFYNSNISIISLLTFF